MSETIKELITLAIETVGLNGGTVIIEDDKTNKEFTIFLNRSANEVKITVR